MRDVLRIVTGTLGTVLIVYGVTKTKDPNHRWPILIAAISAAITTTLAALL